MYGGISALKLFFSCVRVRYSPGGAALNILQRPSVDVVASSAPLGCHATATTLLLWHLKGNQEFPLGNF